MAASIVSRCDRGACYELEVVFPPIAQVIPHRGDAILLSRVLAHDEVGTICEASLGASLQYNDKGSFDTALALELMAQAASVHVSLDSERRSKGASVGYLVRVSRMRFLGGDYEVGDTLQVWARLLHRDGAVGRFEVRVSDGQQIRAEGVILVLEPQGS